MALDDLAVANGALMRLGAAPITSLTEDSDRARLCNAWLARVRREVLRAYPWNVAIRRVRLSAFPAGTLTPSATTGSGVTFTASDPVFVASDVGSLLVGSATASGVARISAYVSATQVKADIEAAFSTTSAIPAESWRIAPAFGWAFRYAKPSDYLRLWEVQSPQPRSMAGLVSPLLGTLFTPLSNAPEPVRVEGPYLLSDIGGRLDLVYIADVVDPAQWDELLANAVESLLAFRICYGVTGSLSAAKTQWEAYQASLAEARTIDSQEGTSDEYGSNVLISVRR